MSFGKLDLVDHHIVSTNRRTEGWQIGREHHLLLSTVCVSHDKFKVVIGHDATIGRPIDSPTFVLCVPDLRRLLRRVLLRRHDPEAVGPILLHGGHGFSVGGSAEVGTVVSVQIVGYFVDGAGRVGKIADLVLPF